MRHGPIVQLPDLSQVPLAKGNEQLAWQLYSHPLAGFPSTSVYPGRQAPRTQAPPWHLGVELGYLPTHDVPQLPQCRGSLLVSTLLSTTPSQSLSRRSQISTPPLVGVHAYSQPFFGSLSMSL